MCIGPTLAVPQLLAIRQNLISNIQLPRCALACILNNILSDGCANEADFGCHCASGKIIERATTCIGQGCDSKEEADALAKMEIACRVTGRGNGGSGGVIQESMSRDAPSSAMSSTIIPPPISSTVSVISQPPPSTSGITSQTVIMSSSLPSTISISMTRLVSASSTVLSTSTPTEMPLTLLPPSDQLSEGSKAGIAAGVSALALSIFAALGWYIRRLKRDLKAAQAVASMSEDLWQANMTAVVAPATMSQRRSWSGSQRGRRMSRGQESPVSPLSPRSLEEEVMTISNNGYGVLKKKRGHILSVVVEQEDEDLSSLVGSVRQPVVGQREGLTGPLELDGESTSVAELPLSVTPRSRSVERS
ncbi:hypothetical protein GQ44DRAFT_604082 [Phaeosphaeriaceae sp. PMI808]|nr:hypothetical protein GQ44DRAFT_604082 [Phaeosphaeriaceae sp. PMI808]